jgi:hypothetical protein
MALRFNQSEELEDVLANVNRGAAERNLVVCPQLPSTRLRRIDFAGDWPGYLDLATAAGARILYLATDTYAPDAEIERLWVVNGLPSPLLTDDDDEGAPLGENAEDDDPWLYNRVREALGPWEGLCGKLAVVRCQWYADGIEHALLADCAWFAEAVDTIDAIAKEAKAKAMDQGALRSAQASKDLYQRAEQLARHERFTEANSEAKREFMAERLFPGFDARRIASVASLIHWWDIEPTERVMQDQRARELYEQGESIRSIAATLKLSESKVRAAIADLPTIRRAADRQE